MDERPPGPGFWQRHGAKLIVSLTIGGGLAWLLAHGGLPLRPQADAFAAVKPWTVAVYVASLVVVHYFRAIRWRHLLRPLGRVEPRADPLVRVVRPHRPPEPDRRRPPRGPRRGRPPGPWGPSTSTVAL